MTFIGIKGQNHLLNIHFPLEQEDKYSYNYFELLTMYVFSRALMVQSERVNQLKILVTNTIHIICNLFGGRTTLDSIFEQ